MKTKNNIVFLKGKKTNLRPVDESELALYVKWINDPEVRQFLKRNMPVTLIAEKKWYEKTLTDHDNLVLVITTKSGKPIGVMGVHRINWIDGTATTGAFIGEKTYWNKGYGTDAKMQVLNYCFNVLNLRKICSQVYDFNKRSLAYSKHCGYKQEGLRKRHVFRNGEYHDLVELAVFREDWQPLWKKYLRGKI